MTVMTVLVALWLLLSWAAMRPMAAALGSPPVEPRVEIVQADAERLAALQVVGEGAVRLDGLGRVGLGQVHEVGAVRQAVRGDVEAVRLGEGAELVARLGSQRRVVPLALRLEEEGKGVGADMRRVLDRVLHSCRGNVVVSIRVTALVLAILDSRGS